MINPARAGTLSFFRIRATHNPHDAPSATSNVLASAIIKMTGNASTEEVS
jgi:hypothetical protein